MCCAVLIPCGTYARHYESGQAKSPTEVHPFFSQPNGTSNIQVLILYLYYKVHKGLLDLEKIECDHGPKAMRVGASRPSSHGRTLHTYRYTRTVRETRNYVSRVSSLGIGPLAPALGLGSRSDPPPRTCIGSARRRAALCAHPHVRTRAQAQTAQQTDQCALASSHGPRELHPLQPHTHIASLPRSRIPPPIEHVCCASGSAHAAARQHDASVQDLPTYTQAAPRLCPQSCGYAIVTPTSGARHYG